MNGKNTNRRSMGTTLSLAMLLSLGATVLVLPGVAQAQCDPVEVAKLLASDGADGDYFGWSVAICSDGTTAIVGAADEDESGIESGSAYVFRFDGSEWIEETKLLASDGDAIDHFGYSVSLSNDGATAIVGAYHDDDNGGNSGSAYVFRYDGSAWIEEAKLLASDGSSGDNFGCSVAVSGNGTSAIVGALADGDNGHRSGSAYSFRFNGSAWIEAAKLLASDGAAEDTFGSQVAVNGDGTTAIVSAYGDDDNGDQSGSVYIFNVDGSGRIEEAKLIASDGAAEDAFGFRVAISDDGTTAIVGALLDDDNGDESGSAYVFRFDGFEWSEEAKLLAADGAAGDWFSYSLDINGDGKMAVVGAVEDDDNVGGSGSAYVFRLDGSGWIEEAKLLASDGGRADNLGYSIAASADGTTAVVGTILVDDNGINSGSAYVFDLNCSNLTLSTLSTCPGEMRFTVQGATANMKVAYIYAYGTGSVEIPPGNPCAGTTLGLNGTAALAGVIQADGAGIATFDVRVPNKACGRVYLQALDVSTCGTTNVVLVE